MYGHLDRGDIILLLKYFRYMLKALNQLVDCHKTVVSRVKYTLGVMWHILSTVSLGI